MNPLLLPSDAPFGAPRFDLIKKEHYLPAFREAISSAKAEIEAITSNPEPPTFSNTVEAMEYAGEALSRVEGIFFNLLEALSDDQMEQMAQEISPELTEFSTFVTLNKPLYERVKAVYESSPDLTKSQQRLLDETYKSFVRNGVGLEGDAKHSYIDKIKELSTLSLQFSSNTLSATNAYTLNITSEADLEGLPDYVVKMAAQEAAERGESGWTFTLQMPSYIPFMKFSTRRELKKALWMARQSRCVKGEFDNTAIITRISQLRSEVAALLGHPTYADHALENRMASSRGTVENFLSSLMSRTLPFALREMEELQEYAASKGFEETIQPWDFSYWSEQLRMERYSVSEQQLKPYFRLEACIDAVLGLATRLYGITFTERNDIPKYHEDVKVFEVKDEDGNHLALFYADFFPRESKKGGAWMTEFRGQQVRDGKDLRPFISIVTSFTKPSADAPSLLTHDELVTFLHEFGHALHGMLSKGVYPSQCGTSVARDFVELPSQLMEHWAYEPEFLQSFARHYQTSEPMPEELVRKIVAAKNFQAAYAQVRQLQFGIIDMAWHTISQAPEDPVAFEKKTLAPYRTLPDIEGTAVSPSFGHIFSGGYSAGYYSYKWAEVLETDAFELFKENGIFDTVTASAFRKNILERGSSEDESVLYRNFRGRDADPEALMRSLGLS